MLRGIERLMHGRLTLKRLLSKAESGFGLPSVLMLTMVLSLLAASVISLLAFSRKQSVEAVNRLKAEYAAESGIATLISEVHTLSDLVLRDNGSPKFFTFRDGSEANVSVRPWGLLVMVQSQGRSRRSTATCTALVADLPGEVFGNALVFGNATHQLVFAGDAHVKGNVIVGPLGASTGSLLGGHMPSRIPVDGRIQSEALPQVPSLETPLLGWLREEWDDGVKGTLRQDLSFTTHSGFPLVLTPVMVTDSAQGAFVGGNVSISGTFEGRDTPFVVATTGDVFVQSDVRVETSMAIYASGMIRISRGFTAEHILLVSGDSIIVDEGVQMTGQLIAPTIHIGREARLLYPTYILSTVLRQNHSNQLVIVSRHARVEGFVGLLRTDGLTDSHMIIDKGALVVGAAWTNDKMTHDGRAVGTVLTRDFHFHQEPTTYRGWLRTGSIDRSVLPQGLLLPPGFRSETRLEVLDWL